MPDARLSGTRVLLVEDETLLAMQLEAALAELGCQVVGPVAQLDAAKRMIRRAGFDCALLDIDLRGRPAYPLAELLDGRGVPYGFVTGYQPDSVAARFRRTRRVLHKPVDADQLKALLLAMARGGRTAGARRRRKPRSVDPE